MEHGEKQITIVDDNGNEQLCEVLFTLKATILTNLMSFTTQFLSKTMRKLKFMHQALHRTKTVKMAS